jgi:hypothetical protein
MLAFLVILRGAKSLQPRWAEAVLFSRFQQPCGTLGFILI